MTAPTRYRRRKLAWVLSACFGVFLLIGVSGLITQQPGGGGFIFAAVLTLIAIVLVIRTFRMATVVVDDHELTIRGFVRSRKIPASAIREIIPLDMPNMFGMAGTTLALVLKDGKRVVLEEFWSRGGPGKQVARMLQELNSWRAARSP